MPNELRCSRLNGTVYTPDKVAKEVARIGIRAVSAKELRVLEPSAGDGAFLRALLANGIAEGCITAVDVNRNATLALENSFDGSAIIEADFIEFSLRPDIGKFDLIVGNPPFIKRVAYGTKFAENIKDLVAESGFPFAEMKNAWAAFVVSASRLLETKGVLALVLPYELITVNYGRAVQLFLVQNGFSIEIFVPDRKAFPELEQDAVIMLACKVGVIHETIRINRVDRCDQIDPSRTATVTVVERNRAAIDIKSIWLNNETIDLLHKLRKEMSTISDYCGSATGVVTAANSYFILKDNEVEQRELGPWARKILKKGSYLSKSPIFQEKDLLHISKTEPCNLIDFFSEGAVALSEAAVQYIGECEAEGVHRRYKCQQRNPWYRIPIVEPGDGLFFKRAHWFPRMCVNEARVLATDTSYQIRMKEEFDIYNLCYSFYNSLTLLFAEIDGRFYGGGVLELTPKEFRGLPLKMLKATKGEFKKFSDQLFTHTDGQIAAGGLSDNQVCSELRLSQEQMAGIKLSLSKLRQHRMRHAK